MIIDRIEEAVHESRRNSGLYSSETFVYIDHVTFQKMIRQMGGEMEPRDIALLHSHTINGARYYLVEAPQEHGAKVFTIAKRD